MDVMKISTPYSINTIKVHFSQNKKIGIDIDIYIYIYITADHETSSYPGNEVLCRHKEKAKRRASFLWPAKA